MAKRVVGICASKDNVTYVDMEVPENDEEPVVIVEDGNWKIQKGDRSNAYQVLHQQCADFVRESGIDEVIIKASAVMGRMSLKLGMLHAAEVRGVVISAAASVCTVNQMAKGIVSRTYGDRRVDEYIEDDNFWREHTSGKELRKLSREAAMLVIAARSE